MSLFTRQRKIAQLAAFGDVSGLRQALVDAACQDGGGGDELCTVAAALVDLGEDGILALVDVILTERDHVHFGRIEDETFHRAAVPRAVAVLSDALLHDPDSDVRLAASGMLRRMDTSLADEAFALAVDDPDPHLRLSAARGLADHGDRRGTRALLEWVAHSDNPVPALVGLAQLGDAALVPVLEHLLASSRSSYAASAIDRTIEEIQAAPAAPQQPMIRLERVRDQLRSIEIVDRSTSPRVCPDAERAARQIPAICDNIDRAIHALRTGSTVEGLPVSRTQVGIELAALVADVSGRECGRLLAAVLDPRGVRAVQDEIIALDMIATELQERATQSGRVEG